MTGKVFSSEHAFPSKILNLFRTLSSWGSSRPNYRPSAPLLYEVASHVKKTAIPAIIYYYYYRRVEKGYGRQMAEDQ